MQTQLSIPVPLRLITLTLQQTVDIILEKDYNTGSFRYEKAFVPKIVGQQLLEADPDSLLIHVELPETGYNTNPLYYLVEEAKSWKQSYARYLQIKEESRQRIREYEKRKRIIEELADTMERRFGLGGTIEWDKNCREVYMEKAQIIYDEKNENMASWLDVNLHQSIPEDDLVKL